MIARLVLLAVGVAGCAAPGATSAPPSAGTPVPTGGWSPPVEASLIARPSPAASVEISMPADFPIFAGATEDPAAVDPPSVIAAWTVDAEGSRVYDFYLEQLPEAGFAVDGAHPGGAAAIIRFTTADGTAMQLDLVGSGPVQVALGPPHP